MKTEHPELESYDSDEELQPDQLAVDNLIDAIYPVRSVNTLCHDFSGYQTWQIKDNIDDMLELHQIANESEPKTYTPHSYTN